MESYNAKKGIDFTRGQAMENVNISTIAQEAGVSQATVSRVLNNSGYVSIKTKNKVNRAIEKYDYAPSALARSLHKGYSDIIGVLVPEIENPFFGEILKVISLEAEKHSLSMICFNSDNIGDRDLLALATMKNYRIKGLIYTPAVDYQSDLDRKNIAIALDSLNAPIVFLDRRLSFYKNADGVFFDNADAAYQATKALVEAGHKKIAIINAEMDRVLARERQSGYEAALKQSSIPYRDDYVFLGDFSIERSYILAQKCLTMEDRPTAVITCNNFTSLGFLKALSETSLVLNKDITCIGFDCLSELETVGMVFNYIERNTSEMAKMSIDLLLEKLKFPTSPFTEQIIKGDLILHNL